MDDGRELRERQMQGGKVVHHGCGYPLWVRPLGQFGESVIVNYRDAVTELVVNLCPGCHGVLQLWWSAQGRQIRPDAVFGDSGESEVVGS